MFRIIGLLGVCAGVLVAAADEAEEVKPGVVASQSVPPAPSTLSLEDLLGIALSRNPTLVQAAAQVQISRGRALQAGLYPNPTVGYVAEQIGSNGTAGEHGGFFQQEIVTGGKLRLSREKYEWETRQAKAQWHAQQLRIQSSVRKAFYQTLVVQRQIEVRRELFKNANDALETTRGLVNVGQANRADLLQAQSQANRIRAELRGMEQRYGGHWQTLTAYVGMPELAPVWLSGSPEVSESEVMDQATMLNHLLSTSPQLAAARAEVGRDRAGVSREAVEWVPNLNLRGEVAYDYDGGNTIAAASVGVKLPLYDRNQGSIMQAKAELARANAEVGRLDLMLRKKFGDHFSTYQAALIEAQTFQKEVLPPAKEAYEAYLQGFQNRRAAWPQVLVAQREYFQLTDQYLETLRELREAEAEIQGLFTGDGLDQPPTPTPQGHRDASPRPR